MTLTYDITKSYQYNYDCGPRFDSPPPSVPETPMKHFLGLPVRSRVGIAAGLLLNTKWIQGYAQRGFDILTYKTVRSSFRPCYPPPNWVFVEDDGESLGPVYATNVLPDDPARVSSAVCFGMPSMASAVWRSDVQRAKSSLSSGQILIVSVVATPGESASPDEVADDFVQCATWAAEAGADVVEANFSCPNVCSQEGAIYLDADLSRHVARRLREALGGKPLLIKAGRFPSLVRMRRWLHVLNGLASGIVLVNGISRPVLHRDGLPVFEGFESAGVLGRTIHQPSVEAVRDAIAIVEEDWLELEIAAVGGVSSVRDMEDFFEAGADAVLMGSSPMYLPGLAVEAKSEHPEW